MKKIVLLVALVLALALSLTACGEGGKDEYKYRYAWIALEGEDVAEGYVTWWRWRSHNSGIVELEIDGRRYTTSYENVVMVDMAEKFNEETEVRPC